MLQYRFSSACVLAGLCVASPMVCADEVLFDTVALTGEAAPLPNGPGDYVDLSYPLITDTGRVAFVGVFPRNGGPLNTAGVFSSYFGNTQLVFQQHQQVDLPAAEAYIQSFMSNRLSMTGQGQVAGRASLFGLPRVEPFFSAPDEVIYAATPGGFRVLATEYGPVPDQDLGLKFQDFGPFQSSERLVHVMNRSGRSTFLAELLDANNFEIGPALFTETADGISMAAYTTGPVPGAAADVAFTDIMDFTFSDAGVVTFLAKYKGDSLGPLTHYGVFSDRDGAVEPLYRFGDIVPNTGGGYSFGNLSFLDTNSAGQVAFASTLRPNAPVVYGSQGYFAERGEELIGFAFKDDPAPDAPLGSTFSGGATNDDHSILINDAGDVLFSTVILIPDVGSRDALYMNHHDTGLSLIAKRYDPAPGFEPTTQLVDFLNPSMNNLGQVVFLANVAGPGSHATRDDALYATDLHGELVLIAKLSQQFDVNSDPLVEDLRMISRINLHGASGGGDGRVSPINDLGQVVFHLEFDDGSEGVFIASLNGVVALPGDTDADGDVDDADLGTAFSNYTGPAGNAGKTAAQGDIDGDGDVDDADLGAMFAAYTGPLADAHVPEPGVMSALIIGGATGLRRRR